MTMKSKKVYKITYDVGNDPYDYYTIIACVCETEELALEKVKELSKGPENPFSKEREELYKSVSYEWDNWLFDNEYFLNNHTQEEVNEKEYKIFGKYGFSKEEIDAYNDYTAWEQLELNNWQIEEIDFYYE